MSNVQVDKSALTKSRNKLNKHRFERGLDFDSDYENAPDLAEALNLGGFSMFKIDSLKEMPEVIRPLMSNWDSKMLADLERELEREVPGFATHKKKLPTGLIDDIFNLFYIPAGGFKFVEASLNNGWRINLLQQLSHYYMRGLTERNSLFSYIVTGELAKMLLEELNPSTPPEPGDPNAEQCLQNLSNNSLTQKRDKALNNAQSKIDQVVEAQNNGTLPDSGPSAPSKKAGDTGTELEQAKELLALLEMMKNISISKSVLNQFVKQSLNMSQAYFSDKYTEHELDILDADEIDDMCGLENIIIPALRAVHLDEFVTHERKYHIGFDVYVDRSGSMTSKITGADGSRIEGLDLVKLTACILLRKGLAKEVFFFDTVISKPHRNQVEVLSARTGGGTHTEMVVKKIIERGNPAIILTDMADDIYSYTNLAYFVGILGAKMYSGAAGTKYLTNGQFSIFDGKNLTIQRP